MNIKNSINTENNCCNAIELKNLRSEESVHINTINTDKSCCDNNNTSTRIENKEIIRNNDSCCKSNSSVKMKCCE